MKRGKEDIISQLQEAVKKQNDLIKSQQRVISYWQDQALMLLDRDIYEAIYGEPHREMIEVRDLGSEK